MPRSEGLGSLFERLEPDAAPLRSWSRQDRASGRIKAIKKHLEWLLNARQGCSQGSPDFGLTDFNDSALGSADLILKISSDIRRAIERYEPRITIHGVHYSPNADMPLELNFRLDCGIKVQNREELIEIALIMNGRDRYTRVI